MVLAPPKPKKAPPTSVETYTFSFDLREHRMKFRLGEETWPVDEFYGKWEILEATDGFRLIVRCKLLLDDSSGMIVGYVWTPKDAPIAEYQAAVPEDAENTHWRLCANKADGAWRLRDERTGYMKSNQVQDYQGVMDVNYSPWYDRLQHAPTMQCNCAGCDSFRHIYHTGPAEIDEEGVAHFAY